MALLFVMIQHPWNMNCTSIIFAAAEQESAPHSRDLLDKLTVPQLVKKFHTSYYGTSQELAIFPHLEPD
jgi:hypothetical protein